MNRFIVDLDKKIRNSLSNNFGRENYDEYRFGKYNGETSAKSEMFEKENMFLWKLKAIRKKLLGRRPTGDFDGNSNDLIRVYGEKLFHLYALLDTDCKKLLVDIIAYRILGYQKIKLPLSNATYWNYFKKVKLLMNKDDTIDPKFLHFILKRVQLKPLGYNIDFYYTEAGVVTTFIVEQYAYKKNDNYIVHAEKGDTVLDLGACWGDTALYFSSKVGENGKVYSFEFIPNNLKIYNINKSLNPELETRIALIENPVSEISGQAIYYLDKGPGSFISEQPIKNQTGTKKTISIDDFVRINNVRKVDFIKMDIEGAEPFALKGALDTIKEFKPKLAIAIYHSMEDFVNIPKWLNDLNLGYRFYLGHYKIHAEETILFAKSDY